MAVAPSQLFETADGWVTMAMGTDDQFVRLCGGPGLTRLTGDPGLANNATRLAHREHAGKPAAAHGPYAAASVDRRAQGGRTHACGVGGCLGLVVGRDH